MIDESIPYRIKRIYSSATDKEKHYLRQILEEIAATGDSQTYRDIWLSDYIEIPVDIDTFLCDDYYLGRTNRNGEAVYPFWKDFMRKLFHAGNQYEEVFFTGATRIGKSSTAITCTAYMLYKLMCLRDPQQYFNKKDVSVFSILFFNLTKDLASGVGYREFEDTVLASPWFLDHGQRMGSDKNPYYIPEGGKVTIDYGSDAAHGLGKQVFCVVGSTKIKTSKGYVRVEDLDGQEVDVAQYSGRHIAYSTAYVCRTRRAYLTTKVTFSDGSVVEGTPDHLIMIDDAAGYMSLANLEVGYRIPTACGPTLGVVSVKWRIHLKPIWVYDVVEARPYHNFINDAGIILHNCGFLDEINFSRAGIKDVSKAKAHMRDLYNTISARVKGTFRMEGEVYGKIFAVSSKRGDSDFMEAYMQEQIDAGAGEHMLIADAPQWEVLPKSMFSPGTFYIAVGDRYKKGFVVPDNQVFPEALNDLRNQGYTLLTPPIDMKSDFLADFDIALRDLAGIAVVGALSFITQDALTQCINSSRRCPFYQDILSIGTKDSLTLQEFFHVSDVPAEYKRMPMFIHLDLSLTTDRTGIGGVVINGRKDLEDEATGRVTSFPTFGHVFSVAIQAPTGDKIPYSKIIAFIKWLRDQGFNIAGISRDQYQSEYVGQLLEEQGFVVTKLSLDRTPDGYVALRSVLLEQRIDMLDHKLLQDELVHLQRDGNTGKIDHIIGRSKDVSDGFCGAVWNAILTNPPIKVPVKNVASAMASINQRSRGTTTLPSMFGNYRKI